MHTHKKLNYCIHILLAVFATVIPTITFATAPSPVLDLSVEYTKGEVIVSWTKVPEADVVNYKVYFSTESILENNGSYDDYIETNGNKSEYTFTNLTPNQKKYAIIGGASLVVITIIYFLTKKQ